MAMSTSTMLIRNVHGTYPPHVAIRRSYIVFTYPIAIGGGHSARHMSESACATSTLISDILLVHDNPGIFLEQRSLGNISRRENSMDIFLGHKSLEHCSVGIFFCTIRLNSGAWGKCRGQSNFGHNYWEIISLG